MVHIGCQEKEKKNNKKHIFPVTDVMLLGYHAFEKYKYLTFVVSEIQSSKKCSSPRIYNIVSMENHEYLKLSKCKH